MVVIYQSAKSVVSIKIELNQKAFDKLNKQQVEQIVRDATTKTLRNSVWYIEDAVLRAVGENCVQ